MESTNISSVFLSKSTWHTILILGLLVGTLDILSAIIDYYLSSHKNPVVIFKYIASAAIGNSAFTGGAGIILLGLLLHYFIAFFFTIFFLWLYTQTNILPGNRLLTGIAYGTFIWIIMNLIVVPLSCAPESTFQFFKFLKSILILICMIGLPLAFLTGRFLKRKG